MQSQVRARTAGELTRATGLSASDYEVLVLLSELPDEPIRALALRCGLEWEKSRLSHQLRRMETRGLVTREECTEDNRGTVIRVSETGRKLAAEARQQYEQAVRRYVTDVLSADQLNALGAIAETVLAQLDEPHSS